MEDFVLDSYCGLYCGACEIMNAYRKSLRSGRKPAWDELPETFRDNIREADIQCKGCKSDTVFQGCAGCALRACVRKRGVDYCVQCGGYPCGIIAEMKRNLPRLNALLPHTKAILANLDVIRETGGEEWLKAEKETWSCKRCGSPVTWYQTECDVCNHAPSRAPGETAC